MVIDSPTSDRGQLVLIGAISLAFILLGVVIVFNSVQYTETIDSGGASDDISEIRTIESEIQNNLQGYNKTTGDIDESYVKAYINGNYSSHKSKGSPIHISYDDGWDKVGETIAFNITITTTEIKVEKKIEVDT